MFIDWSSTCPVQRPDGVPHLILHFTQFDCHLLQLPTLITAKKPEKQQFSYWTGHEEKKLKEEAETQYFQRRLYPSSSVFGFSIESILLEMSRSCYAQPGTLTGTTDRTDRNLVLPLFLEPTLAPSLCCLLLSANCKIITCADDDRSWTPRFPTSSGGTLPNRHFVMFGLMWLNLSCLAAHGSFTVCLAHPAPLSTSKYYSSETRWFGLGWPQWKVKDQKFHLQDKNI